MKNVNRKNQLAIYAEQGKNWNLEILISFFLMKKKLNKLKRVRNVKDLNF